MAECPYCHCYRGKHLSGCPQNNRRAIARFRAGYREAASDQPCSNEANQHQAFGWSVGSRDKAADEINSDFLD